VPAEKVTSHSSKNKNYEKQMNAYANYNDNKAEQNNNMRIEITYA